MPLNGHWKLGKIPVYLTLIGFYFRYSSIVREMRTMPEPCKTSTPHIHVRCPAVFIHFQPHNSRTGLSDAGYVLPKIPTAACLTVRLSLLWKVFLTSCVGPNVKIFSSYGNLGIAIITRNDGRKLPTGFSLEPIRSLIVWPAQAEPSVSGKQLSVIFSSGITPRRLQHSDIVRLMKLLHTMSCC